MDTDGAESRWCAYAWPVAYGNSGNRAFFVDASGEVWQCANGKGAYNGMGKAIPFDAAFPVDAPAAWATLPTGGPGEVKGRDGRPWKRTN